jgi:hypothetical protein
MNALKLSDFCEMRHLTTIFGKEKDKLNLFCLRQLWPSMHNAQLAFHRSSTPMGSPTALVQDGDIEIDDNSC